ncbi:MAG: hypothetical protein ABR521_02530 [Gaiellaceae bacterium]
MTPRRIEVEIGALVLDDPAQARGGEIAVALERELARLAANGEPLGRSSRRARELSAALGHDLSAEAVGTAIARAVGQELVR